MQIRIEELKEHPRNHEFFSDMEGKKWQDFLKSIKESNGPVEPIIITEDNVIVSGHQRVRACRELGIETVNAEVRQYNGNELEIVKDLIETNTKQRGIIDAEDYERSVARRNAIAEYYNFKKNGRGNSITQQELFEKAGTSRDTYKRAKVMMSVEPEIRDLADKGVITKQAVIEFISKQPAEEQRKIALEIDDTIHYTSAMVKQLIVERDEANQRAEAAEAERREAISQATDANMQGEKYRQQLEASEDGRRYTYMSTQLEEAKYSVTREQSKNTQLQKDKKALTEQNDRYQKEIDRMRKEIDEKDALIQEKDRQIEQGVLIEEVIPEDVKGKLSELDAYKERDRKRQEELSNPGYIKAVYEGLNRTEIGMEQMLSEIHFLHEQNASEETLLEMSDKTKRIITYAQSILAQLQSKAS